MTRASVGPTRRDKAQETAKDEIPQCAPRRARGGLPEAVELHAGPLALEYRAGEISNIVLGRHPVVQRIYAAIRDRDWGTIPHVISNERVNQTRDAFHVSFDAENRQGDIDFAWHADITGDALGNISFLFDGNVRRTFRTCRTGLCILHPLETCAGKACKVEKEGGLEVDGVFPQHVVFGEMPPFLDMTGMTYAVTPSTRVRLRFEGDLFEMEDQRNWTDPPFKTFCTPSRLECPREVAGRARGFNKPSVVPCCPRGPLRWLQPRRRRDETVRLAIDRKVTRRVPGDRAGSCAYHGQQLSRREVDCLTGLHLSHLRVDSVTRPPRLAPEAGAGAREGTRRWELGWKSPGTWPRPIGKPRTWRRP